MIDLIKEYYKIRNEIVKIGESGMPDETKWNFIMSYDNQLREIGVALDQDWFRGDSYEYMIQYYLGELEEMDANVQKYDE